MIGLWTEGVEGEGGSDRGDRGRWDQEGGRGGRQQALVAFVKNFLVKICLIRLKNPKDISIQFLLSCHLGIVKDFMSLI